MLSILNSFDIGANADVGLGFDSSTDTISVFGGEEQIHNYDLFGNLISSIISPGESANDFDLSYSSESLTLSEMEIPEDTLLAINGESGATEIYALDRENNSIITTLFTEFGNGNIVGGSYHAQRDSFFLIQNNLPGTLIAEIDPIDGSIINTFSPGADYTVFSGDIEADSTTGNLFIVSSDETSIRELTAEGEFVQDFSLPDGVDNLSAIGLDEETENIWVSNINGVVWQLNNDESVSEPPGDENGIPVYRFLNTDTQAQFYTSSEVERDAVVENLPNYELEGISFIGANIPEEDDISGVNGDNLTEGDELIGTSPVYRFLNTTTGIHLYTADENERVFVEENIDNFVFEGTPYYGYDTQVEGTVPLYRFYNEDLDAHFYTPSTEERDAFVESPDFEPEGGGDGIAFYVEPALEV